MNYEYKSLLLAKLDYAITEDSSVELQKWFDKGWEYI
jgi:hypothetical protein